MTDTQVQTKGRGFIRVSASDELLAGLGNPETPEQWHKALLLPDSYEIEQIAIHPFTKEIKLLVQHEAIPLLEEDHTAIPEVVPYYAAIYKVEDGSLNKYPMLNRIEINQWKNERWETVAKETYFEIGLPDKYEAHFPLQCKCEAE